MGQRSPSVFVSHGAPTLAIERAPAAEFLQGLEREIGRPRAILAVSAHWEEGHPTVSAAEAPETIHDFGGFPRELYEIRYPAPGAPWLAGRVHELLTGAGIESQVSPGRGLDHGAWVPLRLAWPAAEIPVTQLSLQWGAGPGEHLRLGQALAPLREEGVLILGSGSAVHNLSVIWRATATLDWAARFDDWLFEKVTAGDAPALVEYRSQTPDGRLAHPSEEHLLPLFVAMGAGGTAGRSLHRSWTHANLSMAAYAFG